MTLAGSWDVVVIGGGNAGLAAALTAGRLAGPSGGHVLLLDRGPALLRGGNTRHTRNIRCAHSWSDACSPGSYLFAELWRDLCGVGTGPGNEKLAELTVRESESVPAWMTGHGVRWQPPLAGTLHLGRTNRFFLGGGKALVNTYHRALARLGVTVRYGVTVSDLVLDGDLCTGVRTTDGLLGARAVICASGGFEANIDWLRRYWGDAADNYLIRGSADNDGRVLAALYAHGAARAGEERGFHAVAIDARSPRFDGGIATRLDSIPFGIVVNRDGQRFYDEGEDLWPKRYAIWGRNVAGQPGQIAYSLWDAKVRGLFLPPMYPPVSAGSVQGLAVALGLNPDAVAATVRSFNGSIRPAGRFDPTGLDSCATEGLSPAKTHWAQPLDTPPFYAVPLRPGITFTYLGVAVTEQARVLRTDGSVLRNVFAAGEIMSGNILSTGYLAGFGLTIGHVWGRIAGAEAARHAG
jgi:tricarballylate dehydrogenase